MYHFHHTLPLHHLVYMDCTGCKFSLEGLKQAEALLASHFASSHSTCVAAAIETLNERHDTEVSSSSSTHNGGVGHEAAHELRYLIAKRCWLTSIHNVKMTPRDVVEMQLRCFQECPYELDVGIVTAYKYASVLHTSQLLAPM
jgi:hypothetical protein